MSRVESLVCTSPFYSCKGVRRGPPRAALCSRHNIPEVLPLDVIKCVLFKHTLYERNLKEHLIIYCCLVRHQEVLAAFQGRHAGCLAAELWAGGDTPEAVFDAVLRPQPSTAAPATTRPATTRPSTTWPATTRPATATAATTAATTAPPLPLTTAAPTTTTVATTSAAASTTPAVATTTAATTTPAAATTPAVASPSPLPLKIEPSLPASKGKEPLGRRAESDRESRITGFQTRSGQMGFSQKGHKSSTFCKILF